MRKNIISLILKIYRHTFGKKIFYKINECFYLFFLRGLGILNGGNFSDSGEKRFINLYLKKNKEYVIFDVGSCIGGYSRLVLKRAPLSKIYAFEPDPNNYQKLIKNIKAKNFQAFNYAVGNKEGTINIYDYQNSTTSNPHASLYKGVIEEIHKKKAIKYEVKMIKLANFLRENNIPKIDLLKIDTEGSEFNVLLGLEDFLKKGKIKAIQFEFNEMNIISRVFFKDFWDLLNENYKMYRMLSDGLVRIKKYSPVLSEIYAFQNIVALHKDLKDIKW